MSECACACACVCVSAADKQSIRARKSERERVECKKFICVCVWMSKGTAEASNSRRHFLCGPVECCLKLTLMLMTYGQ